VAKNPASADSLIPPGSDFGYAEARQNDPRRYRRNHAVSGFGRLQG
jgi:hypothetical protein